MAVCLLSKPLVGELYPEVVVSHSLTGPLNQSVKLAQVVRAKYLDSFAFRSWPLTLSQMSRSWLQSGMNSHQMRALSHRIM
jgi:hypothetical protein